MTAETALLDAEHEIDELAVLLESRDDEIAALKDALEEARSYQCAHDELHRDIEKLEDELRNLRSLRERMLGVIFWNGVDDGRRAASVAREGEGAASGERSAEAAPDRGGAVRDVPGVPGGRAFVRRVGELQAIEEVVKPFLDGTVRSADLAAWLRARLASGST